MTISTGRPLPPNSISAGDVSEHPDFPRYTALGDLLHHKSVINTVIWPPDARPRPVLRDATSYFTLARNQRSFSVTQCRSQLESSGEQRNMGLTISRDIPIRCATPRLREQMRQALESTPSALVGSTLNQNASSAPARMMQTPLTSDYGSPSSDAPSSDVNSESARHSPEVSSGHPPRTPSEPSPIASPELWFGTCFYEDGETSNAAASNDRV